MWFYDYYIWALLNLHFMGPARMIAGKDQVEDFMKKYSLTGLQIPTICKP